MIRTTLLAASLLMVSGLAQAAVPMQIPLQGTLRDNAGAPVSEGTFESVPPSLVQMSRARRRVLGWEDGGDVGPYSVAYNTQDTFNVFADYISTPHNKA